MAYSYKYGYRIGEGVKASAPPTFRIWDGTVETTFDVSDKINVVIECWGRGGIGDEYYGGGGGAYVKGTLPPGSYTVDGGLQIQNVAANGNVFVMYAGDPYVLAFNGDSGVNGGTGGSGVASSGSSNISLDEAYSGGNGAETVADEYYGGGGGGAGPEGAGSNASGITGGAGYGGAGGNGRAFGSGLAGLDGVAPGGGGGGRNGFGETGAAAGVPGSGRIKISWEPMPISPTYIVSMRNDGEESVTVTTSAPHGLADGYAIRITGESANNYDGLHLLTAVTEYTFRLSGISYVIDVFGGTIAPLTRQSQIYNTPGSYTLDLNNKYGIQMYAIGGGGGGCAGNETGGGGGGGGISTNSFVTLEDTVTIDVGAGGAASSAGAGSSVVGSDMVTLHVYGEPGGSGNTGGASGGAGGSHNFGLNGANGGNGGISYYGEVESLTYNCGGGGGASGYANVNDLTSVDAFAGANGEDGTEVSGGGAGGDNAQTANAGNGGNGATGASDGQNGIAPGGGGGAGGQYDLTQGAGGAGANGRVAIYWWQ